MPDVSRPPRVEREKIQEEPLARSWQEEKEFRIQKAREKVTIALFFLFGISVVATWAVIILKSLGKSQLGDEFMVWLGGAVIAQLAPVVIIAVRGWFRLE